jgi:hypothetical protein
MESTKIDFVLHQEEEQAGPAAGKKPAKGRKKNG